MAKKRAKRRHTGVEYLHTDEEGQRWYRIRCRVRHPKTKRQHEIDRRVIAENTEEAARRLVTERAAWLAKHTRSVPASGPTRLGEAMTAWLAGKRDSIKPSTASTYGSAVAAWSSVLGDYLVSEIDPLDVRDTIGGWIEGGDEPDTADGKLRVLRTFARETKCAAIVEGVRVKRDVRTDERIEDEGRGLEIEELRRFLAAGPSASKAKWWPRAWAMVATMAWTGMRFGEASALEWRDVDLDALTIRVRRAQWRGIVGHVKAKASKRVTVIPAELAELLREHRRTMVAMQLPGCDSPLVFPSRRAGATYVSNTHARKSILRVCKAAGVALEERPAVHMLRHTANNLVRQNASELVRRAMIGHADDESGERYSSVTASERHEALGRVVRMVRGEG